MKKVIYFLMAGILACQFMVTNVLADVELINPDDVAEKGNEYLRNAFGISDTTYAPLKNDSDKKQFVVTFDDNDALYFPYVTDHLEYKNQNKVTTCDDFGKTFFDSISLSMIIVGVYYAAGGTDEQISNISTWVYDDKFSDYDKYGIIIETKDFEYKDENSSCSGNYFEYLKLSFDKEKIQNVIKDFGSIENPNYVDNDKEKFTPSISFGTTSDDYITIAADIFDIYDSEEAMNCNIYKSESEDGEYKLIGTVACDGSNYLYDKDVVKGKKYFYKASVVGNDKLSDAYSATAVTAKSTPSDNPDTGMSMAYVLGALILVLTFATAIVFNRDKIEVK
ncbi:MAG: hypothetical protein SPJ06_01755 [Bacilli bacterium]|nr:hypothetical protein [Bacilli bacterium]